MGVDRRILFVLGEACWLTGIGRFLKGIPGDVNLATYDFREHLDVHTFPVSAEASETTHWIMSQGFDLVILLTNQDALLRDADIAESLQTQGISALAQPRDVAIVGRDKIRQKQFLESIPVPLGAYRVATSVDQAIVHCEKLGFPAVLKMPDLSDGRKMCIARSADDVFQHYYQHAISQPVLVEDFINGVELSTIVFSHGTSHVVFPLVYKGRTEYLFEGVRPTKRVYVSPPPLTTGWTYEVQDLALTVAQALGSQGLLGLDMVLSASKVHIIEINTRMVQTLWMSMLLTRINVLREMVLGVFGELTSGITRATSIRDGLAIEFSIPASATPADLAAIRDMEGVWTSRTRVATVGSSPRACLTSVGRIAELSGDESIYRQVLETLEFR